MQGRGEGVHALSQVRLGLNEVVTNALANKKKDEAEAAGAGSAEKAAQ